jgi:hypothetical protein
MINCSLCPFLKFYGKIADVNIKKPDSRSKSAPEWFAAGFSLRMAVSPCRQDDLRDSAVNENGNLQIVQLRHCSLGDSAVTEDEKISGVASAASQSSGSEPGKDEKNANAPLTA